MKYAAEIIVEFDLDTDDSEEAYEHIDRILQRAHNRDRNPFDSATPGWHYEMFEDCVTNKSREADTLAEKAVCKHCGRRIVNNPDEGWVDPEADGDDVIWRATCERHETFVAEHEPALPFTYQHTHVSTIDGSPAMLVEQGDDQITLVNEDGHQWTDPASDWRPI